MIMKERKLTKYHVFWVSTKIVVGLIHVFSVVNIRRGPQNGILLHKMTAFQQKMQIKLKNVSIEMQRNRFETYNGRLRFKPNYRLCVVKGSIAV